MNGKELKKNIMALLQCNARISNEEIAERLNSTADEVTAVIKKLEKTGVILGYSTIMRPDDDSDEVRAIIEVQVQPERDTGFDNVARKLAKFAEVRSVYLVSGHYDLRLEIVGHSLQEIAFFVASKLSSQKGVKSTATLFMLKKYKEAGIEFDKEEKNERLKVFP
ncbi:MAG: Lrp/AsnC family transcriptional regulator [Lentisphaeria bacterium]